MATVAAPPQVTDLKRLSFVEEAAEKASVKATALYSASKRYVPESVKPKLDQLETSVATTAAPYLHKAQDTSSELLKAMDSKVGG